MPQCTHYAHSGFHDNPDLKGYAGSDSVRKLCESLNFKVSGCSVNFQLNIQVCLCVYIVPMCEHIFPSTCYCMYECIHTSMLALFYQLVPCMRAFVEREYSHVHVYIRTCIYTHA